MNKNPYLRLGLVLSLSGGALAPFFYLVLSSVPLAALALSAVMLGLISAILGSARPNISPEAAQMMLRTGVENIASLLEELGLESKAIYMPSAGTEGRPRALIPLSDNGTLPGKGVVLPNRLVTRYGNNLEDMCLVVTTPGAISLDGIAVSGEGGAEQIEGALNTILTGTLDIADGVSARAASDRVTVDVTRPKLDYNNVWFYRSLGSPLASIAAAVCCQALDRPVRVASEETTPKGTRIHIEVLP